MIQGTFKRSHSGQIKAFTFTGHADSGPYGSDIVCAAISTLAISTVNSLEALAGVIPVIETNETQGGYLHVALPVHDKMTQEQMNISQILLEHLLLAAQSVEDEYLDFVQIKTETKQ
ncbi:ribosomal-processing cysteine protease Prp [Enterococcus sp. CSURQ0835]|uniref:ribosomal-processing cysteine protease Prp n=1 Tax=Enterococcus sp. CSURQ0835 TaxID=2681394 RepID=UPI001356A6DF|nr:ribosomal-processing cysteine protease Prp [Enterococcus sp. CSURQ0835]